MTSRSIIRMGVGALLALVLRGGAVIGADAGPPVKPLRIVAAYHDLETLRQFTPERLDTYHQAILRLQGQGQAETCTIAPEEFERYSSVLIVGTASRIHFAGNRASPEEEARILSFIRDGGTLAVTLPVFQRNFGNGRGDLSREFRVRMHELTTAFPIERPDHPLLAFRERAARSEAGAATADPLDAMLDAEAPDDASAGVIDPALPDPALPDPARSLYSRFSVAKSTNMISVAGNERFSCYAVVPIGKGRLIFVPECVLPDYALMRLNARQFTEEMARRRPLTRGLFAFVDAPRTADVIRSALSDAPPLVFWRRRIPTITTEGPERLIPPYPLPDDMLARLRMDVGRTEWERRIFFTTLKAPVARLGARVSELTGKAGTLKTDCAEVLALALPTRDFDGPNVYLGRPSDLPPAGKPYMNVPRASSILWCVRLHVRDADPGAYGGRVMFDADGKTFSLPLEVTVWPVKLDRRYIDHDVEYFFRLEYDYSEPRMRKWFADYKAAIGDFRAHGVNWVLGGFPGYAGPGGILRSNGADLLKTMASSPALFRTDNPPMLDLSRNDALFDMFITNGMTRFRTYGLMSDPRKLVAAAETIYGKTGLAPESPETQSVGRYWMREQRRYLREKGFPSAYTKIGDEWGTNDLALFVRQARIAQDTGWRVIANPGQQAILNVAKFRDKVWPLTGLWWYARDAEFLAVADLMARRPNAVAPELWATETSSFWWNIAITYGYRVGWELADLGFTGHHFHGWSRGTRNSAGVWLDRTRNPYAVFPCIGYEMLGEGLEDGEYLAMLKEILAAARARGGHAKAVEKIEAELRRITGPGPSSRLEFTMLPDDNDPTRTMPGIGWKNHLSYKDFYRAKRDVLRLTVALQKIAPYSMPDVRWGDHVLVKRGTPVAGVIAGESKDAAMALVAAVRAKTGVTLPGYAATDIASMSDRPELLIAVGRRGEAWIEKLVASLPDCGVTRRYPHAGAYLIYPSPHGATLLIYGDGPQGVRRGVDALLNFLDIRGAWKIKPPTGNVDME